MKGGVAGGMESERCGTPARTRVGDAARGCYKEAARESYFRTMRKLNAKALSRLCTGALFLQGQHRPLVIKVGPLARVKNAPAAVNNMCAQKVEPPGSRGAWQKLTGCILGIELFVCNHYAECPEIFAQNYCSVSRSTSEKPKMRYVLTFRGSGWLL